MKMTSLKQKSQFSQPVCWLSYSKNCEIQRKKAFNPTYGNLFAYAANNPVHYTDPDGREVLLFIIRDIRSYNVTQDRNNPQNTYLDKAVLYNTETGESVTFDQVQTVANYPLTDSNGNSVDSCFNDTVAAGEFELKVYTSTEVASGDAGVIINAKTVDGRTIDSNGNTEKGLSIGRGLEHSNGKPDGSGDYNTPYSKQCFIMPSEDNKRFFQTLKDWGVKNGETVKGKLNNALPNGDML